jgi:hypothetical protein
MGVLPAAQRAHERRLLPAAEGGTQSLDEHALLLLE